MSCADVKNALLHAYWAQGETVKVCVWPRGCQLPEHLLDRATLFLEIGRNLPVPVLDLLLTSTGFQCTLRFGTAYHQIRVPWANLLVIESDDSVHMFSVSEDLPSSAEAGRLARGGLRVIEGGRGRLKPTDTAEPPNGAA